jgi:hypothetical protein
MNFAAKLIILTCMDTAVQLGEVNWSEVVNLEIYR